MVMDAVTVSHQSPDIDVSHEDAEIFEVHLQSNFQPEECVWLCAHFVLSI